jgi:transcriptional regulator with GAF, ATPase, and Fis domain
VSTHDLTAGETVNEFGNRMAELARHLRSQKSTFLTLQQVVTATSEMVKNCDDIAVTTVNHGVVETQAALGNGLAERADQLQQQFLEGPCIDTAWNTPVVTAGALPHDGQWPHWSAAVVEELGIRSLVCVQLFTHEDHALGTLQLFSRQDHAFDDEAVDEVAGIAAHAAVALGAVANLESMQFGLVRRTMIGQATGILMERYGLDAHQGFEVLRRTSQETGRKVYDLAIDLVNGKKPSGL